MPYAPGLIPADPAALRQYLENELKHVGDELNRPVVENLRLQRFDPTPAKPRDGDIFYFPAIAGGFDPGLGFGLYWFDGSRYRLIAGLDESAILGGTADSVVVQDPPDFVRVVNYQLEASSPGMTVDPVAGTIELPLVDGWVSINVFIQMDQTTAFKDFSVIGYINVDGVNVNPFASSYIPQQSTDIPVFLDGGFSRPVAGGEVLAVELQLDGAATASFDVLNCSVEVKYQADLASDAQATTFPAGLLP